MVLHLSIPQTTHTDFTPHITVIGVGGGGTNAVDNMIASNLQGVEFVVANTDAQQLVHSRADRRIQLGPHITQGLGAGAKPEIGRAAAEEAAEELYRHLENAHMVFITAGMGGGTGTGAAPVIARMARERNILTVGVVTKPFTFEGARRARAAEAGIEELQQFVDTLIVIPNQNLFRLANERTGWKEAFKMADNVLYMGVRGVTDLMVAPGLVNLDFADIRTVMAEMGKAMMGTGEAEGENRATRAAEIAISNPLLEDTSMAGARGLLINITGGEDMTLFEVDQAANRIREEVDEEANIIFGSAIDETLQGKIRVSVVATGIESPQRVPAERPKLMAVVGGGPVAMPQAMAAAIAAQQEPAVAGTAMPASAPVVGWAQPAGAAALRAAATPVAAAAWAPLTNAAARPALPITRLQQVAAQHAAANAARAVAAQAQALAEASSESLIEEEAAEEAAAPPARAGARGSSLFAEQKRAAPTGAAGTQSAPPPPRKTLFGIVTGAIRGGAGHAATAEAAMDAEPAPRAEPSLARAMPAEPPLPPRVRQTTGDEIGLEIPAFLRRQSS